MSKLSESLDALNEQIAAFEPDLEKKRETIEKAIRDLVQLKADVQTEEARLFKRLPPMDAKTVAALGYRALMEGKTLAVAGLLNWLLAESVRFAPRKLVTAISRWIAEPAR